MSIQSTLYVDDKSFVILRSSFSYHQNCDQNNRPHAKVFGGLFNISLESTSDTLFTEWAIHPTLMKNIKIVQSPVRMGGKSRTFELVDTVCTYDENSFNATNNEPMKNYITLSPAILKVDGMVLHEKFWKVTDVSSQNVAPTTLTKDAELIGSYITDLEDNELEEYETGDTIRLHIETKNAQGKKINLSLNDASHDFRYNGQILKNDTLRDYPIHSDLEKIELDVIDQQK